jgi:hypothetical protein
MSIELINTDFEQTISEDGTVDLSISTSTDKELRYSGWQLLPDDVYLQPEEITPVLIHMLSRAYACGWNEATNMGISALEGITNSKASEPQQVVRTNDYRTK